MSIEQLANLVFDTYGTGDYAFSLFCALCDLKNDDPELFDGSRSVQQLAALVNV